MFRAGRFLASAFTLVATAGLVCGFSSVLATVPTQGTARVETAPLELKPPDRYQVPSLLEPIRRVRIRAQSDGVVRLIASPIGEAVSQNQELIRLDAAEVEARLKVAQANVKLMQAALDAAREAKSAKTTIAQAEARLEAAKAEAEVAKQMVDRCSLRAPFAGRLIDVLMDAGQYVEKGDALAELADLTSLKALVPVDRKAVTVGGTFPLSVEGRTVEGKVKALVPLPESFATLRELAAPLAAAWVEVVNSDRTLEPGLRVRSPWLPTAPITVVSSLAIRPANSAMASSYVQVIRAEYVTDVPIQVLGELGPERVQVFGPFRSGDVLIVSSSTPLAARTLIRFGNGPGPGGPLETAPPPLDQAGNLVQFAPPAAPVNPAVAPIGAPDSAAPKGAIAPGFRPAGATATQPAAKTGVTPAPSTKGATTKSGSAPVPF